MSNENVAILMSTYNGEKYLEEQVKSIISQDYTDWHLYIRDDGSTDNTVNLIKKIVRDNEKITFLNENKPKNLGVTGSFMDLLANTKAQYYMFSDQDDYWQYAYLCSFELNSSRYKSSWGFTNEFFGRTLVRF